MSKTTWYALGLEDGYTIRYTNGQEYEMNFKNVAITDNKDIDKSSFVLWDRVWKTSEEQDVKRIKAIVKAAQFI